MSVMTPNEVAERLGIQPSTLRKYSLLFEKEQIVFDRNRNNSRNYTVMQVEAIEEAITLSHNSDITLEEAVKKASKKLKSEPVITQKETVTDMATQRHNGDIAAVMMKEIEDLKRIIRQQEETARIREKERKERELMFVEAMEKMQQSMDQVLLRLPEEPVDSALEEIIPETAPAEIEEPVKKKGLFSRFFK
jgi:DNA-binding transcriptional MerR regulator